MKYFLIFSLPLFIACENETQKIIDEAAARVEERRIQDSIMKRINQEVTQGLVDTSKMAGCPIKIISSRLVDREYSNRRDISITFQNASDKKVDAVRFKWTGVDAFGDPADMGASGLDGLGGGFDDDALGAGKKRTSTWSIMSGNAKKITAVVVQEVAFADGSKWEMAN